MKKFLCVALLFLSSAGFAATPTVEVLVHQPPTGGILAFLLTDGTVLVQGGLDSDWWKLTPDIMGSYVNGTWSKMASLPAGYAPEAFASAVLADGRVVITGGEYNNHKFAFTNMGAVYDPKKNHWTMLTPPSGWSTIGDSPSAVLADGSFLVGQKMTEKVARLDPHTLTWAQPRTWGKNGINSEEGWTLMPDGSILTADVISAPNSESYNATTRLWTFAGSTIVDLHSPTPFNGCIGYPGGCYFPPGEIGPQILRPDGTVFVAGSTNGPPDTGHTAIYHPSTSSWTVGPDFPNGDNAGDSGAVLLPSGNVLVGGDSGVLYEFDGASLKATFSSGFAYPLLVLPTGQALLEGEAPGAPLQPLSVYNPTGLPRPAWRPVITSVPASVAHGSTYKISGRLFNGMSQAAAFGDEVETATNYPLVRITNSHSNHVFYARTHDHTSMGVATGNLIVSTQFDVPPGIETGASTLVVVANGITSAPVTISVN